MWESSAQLIGESKALHIYESLVDVHDPEGDILQRQIFNHPPFMIYLLGGLNRIKNAAGIPVHTLLRLLDAIADVGTITLTVLTVESLCGVVPLEAMVLIVIAPSWMFISGFHSNSDPIMLFFLMLTVYCIEVRKRTSWGMVSFALATGIKIVPILLLPALLWYFKTWGERLRALVILAVFSLTTAAPWLIASPAALARNVFGYVGLMSQWGIGWLLSLVPFHEHLAERVFNSTGRYTLILALIAASWVLNRGKRPISLYYQFGILLFLFHLLTPGFGIQYLAWLTPWIVTLPSGVVFSFVAASSAFCVGAYTYWWYYANSIFYWTAVKGPLRLFGLVTWLTVAFVLAAYWRQWRAGDLRAAPAERSVQPPESSHGTS